MEFGLYRIVQKDWRNMENVHICIANRERGMWLMILRMNKVL